MPCHIRSPKEGQSLVEFSLVGLLLFLVLFVFFELGTVFSVYVGLTNSAREAARTGAAFQYDQPVNPTGTPSVSTVDGQRAAAMDAIIMATLNPIIDVANAAELNAGRYSYQPANPSANNYRYGDKLIVSLSYQYKLVFLSMFTPQTITLTAHSEMRLEPGGR